MDTKARIGAVIAAATAAVLAFTGTAAAHGYDRGSGSVAGDGYSNGTFRFHAHNDSRDPFSASGYFTSDSPFGPTLNHLEGRITCLTVGGGRAGFIYQVERSSPPVAFEHKEVKVFIEDNGHRGADKIEFSVTVPSGTFKDCRPGEATHRVTRGYVDVNDGHRD